MYGLNSDFRKKDVAIYARVSTEHEAQLAALENQMDWYKPILAARPDWTLVRQYIDEGITGTSAEKRPQFMKMIKDAKAKEFDMIITREVSRFARNTVDTLQYTRMLKEYGVEVFFINDNIKTFDGDGELRLTIMATLAQDESRKTSIRVKAGQQTSMNNGVFYGNGNILGYDRVGKDLVINPEQAKTVRMIYDMYLGGMGVSKIQYELEKAGRLTATGKEKWFASYISHMLKNSFYCGIITYHKEYIPDYLKQKRKKNTGELEVIQVKGTHMPIVSEEEFAQVQEITAQRSLKQSGIRDNKKTVGVRPHTTVWGRLMVCQCGKRFNLHYHDRKDRSPGVDYQCYTSVNRGSHAERTKRGLSLEGTCDTPFIPGWKLEMMTKRVFRDYISNSEEILSAAALILENHINDEDDAPDYSDAIQRKRDEIAKLNKRLNNLIEMREDGDIGKEQFRERKKTLEQRLQALNEEVIELTPAPIKDDKVEFSARLAYLTKQLQKRVAFGDGAIPENVVEAFIEKIWVSKDEFRWYLRCGNNRSALKEAAHYKIASFTITFEEAKAYQYAISKRKRIYNWVDLNVSIWI